MREQFLALVPNISITLPYAGTLDIREYIIAAAVFAGISLAFWILRTVIIVRLEVLSQRTSNDLDDILIAVMRSIRVWVYVIAALFVAVKMLTIPHWADTALTAVFLFAVVWQAIEIAVVFLNYGVKKFIEKDEDGDGIVDPNAATASHMITLLGRIVLWALGGLFVLSNLGIEVTSLIAGLGIGGIAVAFALQGILSDLFSSFSLYFDKPFRIGDYIVLGQHSGMVEKIGIKTTRIRTLQGEELVVSNSELTTTRVQNFKKMQERRIAVQFGITYETPHELVKQVSGIVGRIFEAMEGARLDRVHFTIFGDSALMYEVVYYVSSSDYTEYLDIQQRFNFELMDKFAELGIEFAYPTQTLHMKKD